MNGKLFKKASDLIKKIAEEKGDDGQRVVYAEMTSYGVGDFNTMTATIIKSLPYSRVALSILARMHHMHYKQKKEMQLSARQLEVVQNFIAELEQWVRFNIKEIERNTETLEDVYKQQDAVIAEMENIEPIEMKINELETICIKTVGDEEIGREIARLIESGEIVGRDRFSSVENWHTFLALEKGYDLVIWDDPVFNQEDSE